MNAQTRKWPSDLMLHSHNKKEITFDCVCVYVCVCVCEGRIIFNSWTHPLLHLHMHTCTYTNMFLLNPTFLVSQQTLRRPTVSDMTCTKNNILVGFMRMWLMVYEFLHMADGL